MKTVYKQLIEDYLEIDSLRYAFLFPRIMNYIFIRLPNKEKYLYVVIREHASLSELNELIGDDWIESGYTRTDKLIARARDEWQWEKERVEFT